MGVRGGWGGKNWNRQGQVHDSLQTIALPPPDNQSWLRNSVSSKRCFRKGVGNSKNASEKSQKCGKNTSKWVLFYWERRNFPKCVRNASKMRGTPLGEKLPDNYFYLLRDFAILAIPHKDLGSRFCCWLGSKHCPNFSALCFLWGGPISPSGYGSLCQDSCFLCSEWCWEGLCSEWRGEGKNNNINTLGRLSWDWGIVKT